MGQEGKRPRGVRYGRSVLLRTEHVVGVRLRRLSVELRRIGGVQLPTSRCRSVAGPMRGSGRWVWPVSGWVVEWCLDVATESGSGSRAQYW